jgi:acyl-CoA thioesterase
MPDEPAPTMQTLLAASTGRKIPDTGWPASQLACPAVSPRPEAGIDGVSRFFGIRWETADTVRLTIRPELINAGGLLSGVATYALIDYCMGSALWKETAEEEAIATVNISINYVQTATEGEVVCKTTLDRRNRRLAVLSSKVHADDGRLLATAIGSYTIFPRRKVQRADS